MKLKPMVEDVQYSVDLNFLMDCIKNSNWTRILHHHRYWSRNVHSRTNVVLLYHLAIVGVIPKLLT